MQFLLENGAKIDWRNNAGSTPLHYASFYGEAKAVEVKILFKRQDHRIQIQVLCNNGAYIEARGQDGMSPLHFATFSNRIDAAKVVLCLKPKRSF